MSLESRESGDKEWARAKFQYVPILQEHVLEILTRTWSVRDPCLTCIVISSSIGSELSVVDNQSRYIKRVVLHTVAAWESVEIHLIPMDPVALTLKVEQKVALTGLAGLAR